MAITSQQKKFGLPLAGFVASFIAYLIALGSVWAIVLVAPMITFLMTFLIYNASNIGTKVREWIERDGWR